MFMTLKREWEALDASGGLTKHTKIPAGRHEIEKITNPLGHPNSFWFVLKGTLIGGSQGSWRQWENRQDEYGVVIEE